MPEIAQDPLPNLSPEFQKAYQSAVIAERKPIAQIELRKSNIQEKATLLDDLISKVDNVKKLVPQFGTPFAIRDLAFLSDEPKILSGSADKSLAEPGKHSLEILQLANSSSALSNGFADKDETRFGTGYIRFETLQGDTKEVFIDYDNATLDGIAKTINSSKTGIRATVITDSSDSEAPYKLLFSSSGIGATSDINFPEFYLAGGEEELIIDSQKDASNAIVKYQGFQIESPTNEIKDLKAGVTLNIKGTTGEGRPTTVTIDQDIPKTMTKMKELVEKMNLVFSFIQEQNKMDEKTQTQKTLGGDYAIRLAEQRLRTALSQNYLNVEGRSVQTMADLGVQFNKNGTLNFEEKKFEHALETNFDEVVDFMAGDSVKTGVMTQVSAALNTISNNSVGVLSNQRKNYADQIKKMDRDIDTKDKQSKIKSEELKNKLAKAQASLSSLQNQSNLIQGGGSQSGIIGN